MEEMCHRLAATFFNKTKEPIPDFSNVHRDLLKSAINLPRATYDKKELYPTLIEKSAILFYTLIKNHPFPNGNKRIATTSLLVFLYLNDYWVDTPKHVLYKKAIKVAESDAKNKDKVLAELHVWLRKEINRESEEGRLRKLLIGFWGAMKEKMSFRDRRRKEKLNVPVIKMKKDKKDKKDKGKGKNK
jgi:death-on-curing protein